MPERICKLQPHRTLALRGFSELGASAALHSATPDRFVVSGCFRDPADFAVLMLYDADNFYEHPRLKYLPDFSFAGLTLTFDVRYTGLMPLDSPKYPTIDWHCIDVMRPDHSRTQIRLAEHATVVGGAAARAECSFTIEDNGLKQYDRLTLWYQNLAFDYIAPAVECTFAFLARGAGTPHTVQIEGTARTYIEQPGDSNTAVALGVAAAVAGHAAVSAEQEAGAPNQVMFRAIRDDGVSFDVSANGLTYTLTGVGASAVAQALAAQINAGTSGQLIPLEATVSGAEIRIRAKIAGVDGNMLSMYAVSKNDRMRTTAETATFSGGSSDAVWRVSLDFSALGVTDVRQMWMTFAPPLANAAAFEDLEWEARFTNWSVTGPEGVRALKVAGSGSVRVEDSDSWCRYTGEWELKHGFHSEGFARLTQQPGSTVCTRYACGAEHDLYLGTTLGVHCGIARIALDGGAPFDVDCSLPDEADVNTRRLLRARMPAGQHTVEITFLSGSQFWFDFIEAAIPADVPDALPARTDLSPALDYSTDHTYKLPPARIHWIFDKLGYAGPMNEYIGVFWWNQRRRVDATLGQTAITFDGEFRPGDGVFIRIGEGPFEFGKSVFPGENSAMIARHFEQFINGYSVGVWAKANGNKLTITCRSPKAAYAFELNTRVERVEGSTGTVAATGSLQDGVEGKWIVDVSHSPALNRGARDWHADMFRECAARHREITTAASMELVQPPEGFGAVYLNGDTVRTDVGFGQLYSTHCSFSSVMQEYQKSVYACIAGLMSEAGLTPNLQFGEFVWWFFNSYENEQKIRIIAGMAYYDDETKEAARLALGRPLHGFGSPMDDPGVNGGADALFLRNRLREYVSALVGHVRSQYPNARFEVLFPYDVNHPEPVGMHNLGGRLNRFVNLPAEWEHKETCGFDRLKTEALDFGAWNRNLDLARTAWELPIGLGWPKGSLRHLTPIFRAGHAWDKEVALARAAGIPVVNLWAWDHVCLYNLPVTEQSKGRSTQIGG